MGERGWAGLVALRLTPEKERLRVDSKSVLWFGFFGILETSTIAGSINFGGTLEGKLAVIGLDLLDPGV